MIRANFSAYGSYVTDSLYQWDKNQDLAISGLNLTKAPEIHFSNMTMDRAIVRQSTLADGVVTVRIPNSLLQVSYTIKAYVGVYEGETFKVVETIEIPIIAKTKPTDYTFEDSDGEIYSFNKLENEVANTKQEVIATVKETIKTLESRVTNIIAHNNDTEGNTELIDIRTGANGTVYESAGDAVRVQISELSENVTEEFQKLTTGKVGTNKYKPITDGFLNKSLIQADGTIKNNDTSYANYIVTPLIPVEPYRTYTHTRVLSNSLWNALANASKLYVYDADGNPLKTIDLVQNADESVTFTTPSNASYICLSVSKATILDSNATLDELVTAFNNQFMLVYGKVCPNEFISYDAVEKSLIDERIETYIEEMGLDDPPESLDVVQTTGDSETAVMSQKATTQAIEKLGFTENTDSFIPPNILEDKAITYKEGSSWGANGLVTNQYTTKYTSIEQLIDVHEGVTYKIPKFKGIVMLYNENGSNGEQIAHTGNSYSDFEFTIPEGKTKIGISYITADTPRVECVYRLTIVSGDESALPIISERFSLQPQNIQSEEIKEKIKSLIPDSPFEIDTDSFIPPNILEDKAITYKEGSSWGANGLTTNQYTVNYTSIEQLFDVVEGYRYKIPLFDGSVRFYDETLYDGEVIYHFDQYTDFEFTIPEGKTKLGVSYRHSNIETITAIYRLTPTEEEKSDLPLKNNKFSIQLSNIINKAITSIIAPLKDKIIVNFGDSIFGNYEAPEDISTLLAELTGATVYNCGFGGSRLASHTTSYFDAFSMYRLADAVATSDYTLQDQAIIDGTAEQASTSIFVTKYPTRLALLKTIDFNKVDIITIAYGTNDFTGWPQLDNESNPTHTDYISGALRYSIEKLLTAYPHLKIFICSPIYRCWNNADGTLDYDSDSSSSAKNGVLLTDIVSKEKAVAKEYHLPFIDNYYELGINKINRLNYFSITDGTHPNVDGRKLIAEHIAKELF